MVSRDHVVFLILPLQAPKPIKLKETSIPANSPKYKPPHGVRDGNGSAVTLCNEINQIDTPDTR